MFFNSKRIDALNKQIADQLELIEKLTNKLDDFHNRLDKIEQDVDENIVTRVDAYLENIEWDERAREAIADIDMSDIAQEALDDVVRHASINISF
jgi:predicted  nucleic acid-binding Zn-ribbon protein